MNDWFIFVVGAAAFMAALLTFFSGFGLGTLLAPVFMIFFPIDVAIALTGVVHFFNGIFKVLLVGKHAVRSILLRFGIPSVIAAPFGAWLLFRLPSSVSLVTYSIGSKVYQVTSLGLIMAFVLFVFALWELWPTDAKRNQSPALLPIGGTLSGFFGGFSGHQGALRSAFLVKEDLSTEAFLGTTAVIAVAVDVSRIGVYTVQFSKSSLESEWPLVLVATMSAMTGAFIGNKLVKKVTISVIRMFVGAFLLAISVAIGMGVL
jgi:uncharacterized membrane protein YfcA